MITGFKTLDRLAISAASRVASLGDSSGGGLPSPWQANGATNWTNVQTISDLRKAILLSTTMYACTAAWILNYQQIRFIVTDRSKKPLPDHPLQALLDGPNKNMGQRRFNAYRIMYGLWGGQCYTVLFQNGSGRPIGYRPFSDAEIEPIPLRDKPITQESWIERYDYRTGRGKPEPIDPDRVIMQQWPNVDPDQPWKAMSPFRPALKAIMSDVALTDFPLKMMENGAFMTMLYTLPPESASMPNDIYKKIKADIVKRYGGAQQFSPGVLRGGMKGEMVLPDFQKADFTKLTDRPDLMICADARVPAIYAGVGAGLDRSTKANMGEAHVQFVEDAVIPMAELDADDLTRGFRPFFGDGFLIIPDTSGMYALQQKDNERRQQANEGYQKYRTWTLDEARGVNKLPPVGGTEGDSFFSGPAVPDTQIPASNG
jgi:phage portal protein BeeE